MMPRDFKDLLRTLNANAAEYLIVGGHALSVYTEPRATKDLDLFIRSDPANAKAVFRALAQFGVPLHGMSPSDFADGSTFQLGQPPHRIDILQHIDGVTFEEAWQHRVLGNVDREVPACVISREDLIRNKLASGREQNLLDVKALRSAEESLSTPDRAKKSRP